MGNTIAVKLHTRHGEEMICDVRAHVLEYELAMLAWFSGCVARPVHSSDGVMSWEQIAREIRPLGPHRARTALIEIENTNNIAGGTVYPLPLIHEICDRAHERGLKVHMDGARVFNAAEATGKPVREIVAKVDTVMFCLSKALGAPVGSMLAGTAEDIDQGRLYRKRLGGGLRQAGVLAAAGLIALEQSPRHLIEDHRNARLMAKGLAQIPGIKIDPAKVQTNIVIFDVSGTGLAAKEVSARLKEHGVLINPISPSLMRLVTHYDVDREGCEMALSALAEVAALHSNALS
jgi:threonine aldolase